MRCLDICWNWEALNVLTAISPPCSALVDKDPWLNNLPFKSTRGSSCLSWRILGFQLPASFPNCSNKPITSSYEPTDTSPSWYYEACLPSPWLSTLLLNTTLLGLRCPPNSPGSEYIWLTNCCWSYLSSVGSSIFSHPYNPRARVPPSPIE